MTDTVIIFPGVGEGAEPGLFKTGNSGTVLTPGADLVVLPISNYWASTEAPDTFTDTGYPGYIGSFGQFVLTEADDTIVAIGLTSDLGMWRSTDAPDIFGASGRLPIQGPWTSTEAIDHMTAVGIGRGVNGIWVETEAPDIFVGAGAGGSINGTFVTTEITDRFFALGAGAVRATRRRQLIVT